jgi:inositol-1,4,5-trisphosphate 5-phosphatase
VTCYRYDFVTFNDSIDDVDLQVRVPAWTDRILFKIEDTDNVEATLHSYESLDEIYGSDHKPVKAHICLRLPQTQTQ